MPQADAWEAHLRRTCARWTRAGRPVAFAARRLAVAPAAGDSVEAWARDARYAALASLALEHGCRLVLLAHHQGDQAETVLLQALRGAGPAGLAAMAPARDVDGVAFARPWLDVPRAAIEAYARRHRLRWVDDDSNADPRFARNRLRQAVLPALVAAFPGAATALARAARLQQQAAQVLSEVATSDLAACRDGDALVVAAWAALSPGRRAGVLRAWLDGLGTPADGAMTDRLLDELPAAQGGARWPLRGDADAPTHDLRLHRGRLRLHRRRTASDLDVASAAPAPLRLDRPGQHVLPGASGRLQVSVATSGGVPWALLAGVVAAPRRGGERFQAGPGRPARALKKQFQAARVPAWQRDAPLLWTHDGRLLFVPGLGVDARCRAADGEAQAALDWLP